MSKVRSSQLSSAAKSVKKGKVTQPQISARIDDLRDLRKKLEKAENDLAAMRKEFDSLKGSISLAPAPSVARLEAAKVIRNPQSGRLDARAISAFFNLSLRDLSGILKLPNHQAMAKTPDANSLQARLSPFEEIVRGRLWFRGDDALFRQWLNTPNEELAEIEGRQPSPMEFIRLGHPEVIARQIRDMLSGQPA